MINLHIKNKNKNRFKAISRELTAFSRELTVLPFKRKGYYSYLP
ncbi:hypothetical protein ADIS_0609 [Lunatimonas lonarensis]|uniref:Uncharacterized protein n=1 Tax=Lunatimonas lonarensis TaxID=1232681 RepID=R7ZXB4_9BACT|nr:hypothetical protein ADIS_0609 [Lunatimonas lonarensis]